MTIFKDEPRNVRLSLEADGFNPFSEIHYTYVVWLLFVIKNNLPPWMHIKAENTMLKMIILGIFLKAVIILFHKVICLIVA